MQQLQNIGKSYYIMNKKNMRNTPIKIDVHLEIDIINNNTKYHKKHSY